jgi:hypothetical protein
VRASRSRSFRRSAARWGRGSPASQRSRRR